MAQDIPMTQEGKKKLDLELEHLLKVERETLKIAIAEARAKGDLSENADYAAAKEKQSHVEGRILMLQDRLGRAQVIDISKIKNDKIVFGATVTLHDTSKNIRVTYQIVGDDEADLSNGKISLSSPLGRALIGKEEGDQAVVKAPKGDVIYDIESFEYR